MMYYFLKDFVGVSEKSSNEDSCKIEHLLSKETREKLFEFMKDLICSCSNDDAEKKELTFSTSLELCDYETIKEFVIDQK